MSVLKVKKNNTWEYVGGISEHTHTMNDITDLPSLTDLNTYYIDVRSDGDFYVLLNPFNWNDVVEAINSGSRVVCRCEYEEDGITHLFSLNEIDLGDNKIYFTRADENMIATITVYNNNGNIEAWGSDQSITPSATLTDSGRPADSKAVGDKFGEIGLKIDALDENMERVIDILSDVETVANKTTVINDVSDDTHYPSAKAVYDYTNLNGVPHIYSEQSNAVHLRSLESGTYILQGVFLTREDTSYLKLTTPMLVSVDKNDDRKTDDAERNSQLLCFSPSNAVKYICIPKLTTYPVVSQTIKLGELETSENRVTVVNSTSDDEHYPTAKAVYDYVGSIEAALDNIITIQENLIGGEAV